MGRLRWIAATVCGLLAAGVAPAAAGPAVQPPTGLRTTAVTASSIALAWSSVPGATGYDVLRGAPGSTLTTVARVTVASYADSGLASGTDYVYAVATVKKQSVSAPSTVLTVRTVPAPPQTVVASALSPSSVHVEWSTSVGATSYQVWRSTPSTSPSLVASLYGTSSSTGSTAPPTSWNDQGLAAQTTYRYTVRSGDESGVSPDSPAATVTTPAPSKVTPTVRVTSSPNPSSDGDRVVVTVQVSSTGSTAVPTGTVSLQVDGATLTSALNPNGVATFDRVLSTGSYLLTATYGGDDRFTSATGSTTQQVNAAGLLAPYVAYATGSSAASVVVADVNGDGRKEAVVATTYSFDPANDYMLFVHDFVPGTAAPVVTKVPTGDAYGDTAAMAAGDLDGDGTDDVVLATGGGVKVFLGSPTGLRAPALTPTAGAVTDVVVADLTGDGRLDVLAAVKGPDGGNATLLPGLGDGSFGPASVLTGAGRTSNPVLGTGDFTGDGHDDVALLWGNRTVEVMVDFSLGDGPPGNWDTWSISTLAGSQWPTSLAVGDVTGDGWPDVVVTAGGNRPDSQLIVMPRDPAGRFGPQQVLASYDIPEPVVVADVDRDGMGDVVTVHGGWNAVGVYRQSNSSSLTAEQLFTAPYASHYKTRGLAVGDVTSDGKPDVLLADYNHGLVLLAGR